MQKIEDAYSQSINRLIIIDHEVIFYLYNYLRQAYQEQSKLILLLHHLSYLFWIS